MDTWRKDSEAEDIAYAKALGQDWDWWVERAGRRPARLGRVREGDNGIAHKCKACRSKAQIKNS